MKGDLEALNCAMICWNWNIASAGVVCRLNNDLRPIFKFDLSLEEVVAGYFDSPSNTASTVTIEA